jgi:uncharacterized membrane protein
MNASNAIICAMDWAPLQTAPLAIRIHFATVMPAFLLGLWLLLLSLKGSTAHRSAGVLYLALMYATAISALFIPNAVGPGLQVGPLRFGFIHLFIVLTTFGLARAMLAIRRGDVQQHGKSMRGVYVGGLLIAGLFTLAPGRILYRVLFG